ncbi:predicted protein [Coccidioides posadasii str. Silveira]|uniref:Predicted protein n=1 Tax=Coccidioides posadasii (strain RMSCC 757 / Silveira) TaxID=443226 RepID=E9D0D1_COCPS|nr:predicted protein [Coccidioides posadasii str. Silveira]
MLISRERRTISSTRQIAWHFFDERGEDLEGINGAPGEAEVQLSPQLQLSAFIRLSRKVISETLFVEVDVAWYEASKVSWKENQRRSANPKVATEPTPGPINLACLVRRSCEVTPGQLNGERQRQAPSASYVTSQDRTLPSRVGLPFLTGKLNYQVSKRVLRASATENYEPGLSDLLEKEQGWTVRSTQPNLTLWCRIGWSGNATSNHFDWCRLQRTDTNDQVQEKSLHPGLKAARPPPNPGGQA